MLRNPCFYVFGDAFSVVIVTVHILKPYFRLINFFINKLFNTILKLTGAYIMIMKTAKSKYQYMNDKLNSHKTVKYLLN